VAGQTFVYSRDEPSLNLLTPVPQEQLLSWLSEFYGKPAHIMDREVLRHGDSFYVERLWIADSLPKSLIYKLVMPPWDVEQELHERVLIPSISNSAQLYLSAHYGAITALFLEDLGTNSLCNAASAEIAGLVGKELAKMHRAYSYRTDELIQSRLLRTVMPLDYGDLANELVSQLGAWQLLRPADSNDLGNLARVLAAKFAGEPTSLVHGDLFAENIILRGNRFFVIDWSWFTILGVPLMDLATLTMSHPNNGSFPLWKNEIVEAYCFESAREPGDVMSLLPHAETLRGLLFLDALVERKKRSMSSTTGHLDILIPSVVKELSERLALSAPE
jgi:hypothetical protein